MSNLDLRVPRFEMDLPRPRAASEPDQKPYDAGAGTNPGADAKRAGSVLKDDLRFAGRHHDTAEQPIGGVHRHRFAVSLREPIRCVNISVAVLISVYKLKFEINILASEENPRIEA